MLRVHFSLLTTNFIFFQELIVGARAAADRAGLCLTVSDADGSRETQIAQVTDASDCDALIVVTGDRRVLEHAFAVKVIPTVLVDFPLGLPDIPFVGSDSYSGGLELGKYVAVKINPRKEGIRVLALVNPVSPESELRLQGFLDGLRKVGPASCLCRLSLSDIASADELRRLIEEVPDADCLFGYDGVALELLLEASRGMHHHYYIAGFDLSDRIERALETNTRLIAVEAQNPQLVGEVAVQHACILAAGAKLVGSSWLPPKTLIPCRLVLSKCREPRAQRRGYLNT
ncbi:MAG: substrate-binding domain-containing protein [Firmicutes bacterium]|nr:substrate-binding domain-containing protein [Bacillota bacterium]